jgi:hypothetical protein
MIEDKPAVPLDEWEYRCRPGSIRWVDDPSWKGPPKKVWLVVLALLLGFCLYSMYVHADGPKPSRCTWEKCKVAHTATTLELVDCEPAQEGTHLDLALAFQNLKEAERAIRYTCGPEEKKP